MKANVLDKVNKKILNKEKNADNKAKELVSDIEKSLNDEQKIEIMTQFRLDPTSSATKLLEKRREMYELQEHLHQEKINFAEKETTFQKTED